MAESRSRDQSGFSLGLNRWECLEKVQRDLDRKVLVAGAGRGSPGRGTGRFQSDCKSEPAIHAGSSLQVWCCWGGCLHRSSLGEQRRGDWEGGSMPEMSDFHWSLWGRWAGNALFPLSCIKMEILFTQDLSYPRSHNLGCSCSVVLQGPSPWEAGCSFDFLSFLCQQEKLLITVKYFGNFSELTSQLHWNAS